MGVKECCIFFFPSPHFSVKYRLIGPDRRYAVHDALEDFRRVLAVWTDRLDLYRQMPRDNARRWLCDFFQRFFFYDPIALIRRGLDVGYQVQAHRHALANDIGEGICPLAGGGFRHIVPNGSGLVQAIQYWRWLWHISNGRQEINHACHIATVAWLAWVFLACQRFLLERFRAWYGWPSRHCWFGVGALLELGAVQQLARQHVPIAAWRLGNQLIARVFLRLDGHCLPPSPGAVLHWPDASGNLWSRRWSARLWDWSGRGLLRWLSGRLLFGLWRSAWR